MSGSESVESNARFGVSSFTVGLEVGVEVLRSAPALNLPQALAVFLGGPIVASRVFERGCHGVEKFDASSTSSAVLETRKTRAWTSSLVASSV